MLTLSESLALLTNSHVSLVEANTALDEEWAPNRPPPTVLSSVLAKALVAAADTAPEKELFTAVECVERILATGDEVARDVVATGFLEAIVASADAKKNGGLRLMQLLGPLATNYCKAWKAFTERT